MSAQGQLVGVKLVEKYGFRWERLLCDNLCEGATKAQLFYYGTEIAICRKRLLPLM